MKDAEKDVAHAHWIDREYNDGYIETACSNCGWSSISINGWRSYYCPYCGAKMEEEEEK